MKRLSHLTHHRGVLCAATAASTALIIALLLLSGLAQPLSLRASDSLYTLKPAAHPVKVIAVDDASLQQIGRWPWNRSIHAELIGKIQSAKAIGIDISFFENSTDEADNELAAAIRTSSPPVVLASEFGFRDGKQTYLKPIVESRTGHVNLVPGPDGVVRNYPAQIGNVQAFSAMIAQLASEKPLVFPQDVLIQFFEQPAIVSYADVLYGRTTEKFDDAVVLIGVTAPDFHDDHLVPVSKRLKMPGVVIHAHAISTLLEGGGLARQPTSQVLIWILLISAIAALAYWRLQPLPASGVMLATIATYAWIAITRFESGTVYDLLHPITAGVIAAFGCIGVVSAVEAAHRRRIANVFGKYVSKAVASEIIEKTHRGEEVTLKGKRRTITVMFGDVRGFTPLSERLEPEQVVSLLNRYLRDMTQAIFDEEGTIDKYIGDAIMAMWNAPLDQKDHAVRAVRAGLKMQESAAKHRATGEPLNYGIGINTGPAVVGNIGSEERLEYTAIGDAVNLASRLCGKAGPGDVIISESTYKLVKDLIECERLAPVEVKGKSKKIQIYRAVRVK